jgi:putative flippase GtrA
MNNKKELMKEILRFLLVGGLATLVDFGIYELCRFVLFQGLENNVNLILSTSLGFIFGNIVSYILSIIFVFKGAKDDKSTPTVKAFLIFTVIGIIGLGIKVGVQTGGNYLMSLIIDWLFNNFFIKFSYLTWAWLLDTFVYCVATLIVLIWNYIGRKIFIFKGEKK